MVCLHCFVSWCLRERGLGKSCELPASFHDNNSASLSSSSSVFSDWLCCFSITSSCQKKWVVKMGGVVSTKISGVTLFVLNNAWQFSSCLYVSGVFLH